MELLNEACQEPINQKPYHCDPYHQLYNQFMIGDTPKALQVKELLEQYELL
jgi:hypothetical protein